MKKPKALLGLFGVLTIMASMTLSALPSGRVEAAQITARSLTLEAGTDPGSKPGGTVKHLFKFSLHDTADQIGSLTLQYCTTAAAVSGGTGCIAPAGIDVSGGTITQQLGITTWTTVATSNVDDTSDGVKNMVTITNGTPGNISADPTPITLELNGIVNPSTANQTFFVRISTYTSGDGSGTALESGTVAASTANPVVVQGTMPESLVFCTGDTVGLTNGVPDCTTATNNTVAFNQLFSPTSTAYATSQFAASTNATTGYAVTVNGTTLTSGANTINPIYTGAGENSDQSKYGVSQFGMNLVVNDATAGYANSPVIPNSAAISPATNGTNYNGEPTPSSGFETNGYFEYHDGSTIADSTSKGTDAQIYTVSYIVNVPGSLPAGTYQSTLTYICTPTF